MIEITNRYLSINRLNARDVSSQYLFTYLLYFCFYFCVMTLIICFVFLKKSFYFLGCIYSLTLTLFSAMYNMASFFYLKSYISQRYISKHRCGNDDKRLLLRRNKRHLYIVSVLAGSSIMWSRLSLLFVGTSSIYGERKKQLLLDKYRLIYVEPIMPGDGRVFRGWLLAAETAAKSFNWRPDSI